MIDTASIKIEKVEGMKITNVPQLISIARFKSSVNGYGIFSKELYKISITFERDFHNAPDRIKVKIIQGVTEDKVNIPSYSGLKDFLYDWEVIS